MSDKVNDILTMLKGFTFDGDTGRTIRDLYAAVDGTGCTRDAPFVGPWWIKGDDTPAAVNSYLDPDGQRVHLIWQSDRDGLSEVIDVIFDAPSLAKEEHENDGCADCSIEMMRQMSLGEVPSEDS
jgi:hypothetical protein